jgi:2'-5' RNA ligase
MRLFVSVDLEGLADAIAAVQEPLADAPGIRLTDPAQAHVTLKFLGDTDPDRRPALGEALAEAVAAADVSPFEAEFGGLGVFPSLEYISVVWVGVREGHGAAELTRLHEEIEERTVDLGFDPEDHAFTPHVTVARMDHAGGKELVQNAVRERDPDVGSMTVSEVRLTESTLTDDGPVYETVERFSL